MISTRDVSELPDLTAFRRLTRSLATLDAILSPEWEDRYYSFDAHWGPGELMASMRNGQGDHWFSLIGEQGAILHGLDHEAAMYRPDDPWPGILEGVPAEFSAFLSEPAFDTRNTTFCLWTRAGTGRWEHGPIEFAPGDDPDGSARLLRILDGRPETYVAFAREYYEVQLPVLAVAEVYRHAPITPQLLERLDSSRDLESLASDLAEIGYPDG